MRKPSARRLAVTTALVLGSLGASVAVATWSADGSGTSRASSLSALALTATAQVGTADLYPGFTAGDVHFTVANPNPYPVTLTSASFGSVVSSNTTDCPSTNVTMLGTKTGLTLVVPAGATAASHVITDVVTMINAAPDGCQNKSFSVALTLTGAQS